MIKFLCLLFATSLAQQKFFQKVTAIFEGKINFSGAYTLFLGGGELSDQIAENPAVITNVEINPGNPTESRISSSDSICESHPLDVVILMDSSRSMSLQDFETVKASVKALLIDLTPINRGNTQVSLIQYGTRSTILHSFADEQSESALLTALLAMHHTMEDHTYCGEAISVSLAEIFPKARDIHSQKARRVIIILTDGEFQDKKRTIQLANKARNENVDIYAIGIGAKSRRNQLEDITGFKNRVFFRSNFSGLLDFIRTLKVVQFDCFATTDYIDYCHKGTVI